MKESIFFNREQLKIIRWYGYLYQGFFEYGIWIMAFVVSLLLSWGLVVASGYFTSPFLVEKISTQSYDAEDFYRDRQQKLRLFQGVEAKVLNGKLLVESGSLTSQSNLLSISGIALPNITQISSQELSFFTHLLNQQQTTNSELNQFFSSFLVKPLTVQNFGRENSSLLPLTGTLKDTFGLTCLQGATNFSPICRSYLNTFLENFYFYDLGENKEQKSNEVADTEMIDEMFIQEMVSSLRKELVEIFQLIKSDRKDRDSFCRGLLRYGSYGGTLDNSFTELFRSCGNESYTQFALLRDFSEISRGLALGYSDSKVYSNTLLNQYKLFSLQQLLYKQLLASADVKPLMQSYLRFLREILMREANKKVDLLGKFPKMFTYRYNTNIVSPYLKDEKSKMEKGDRTTLMSQLSAINYGDRNSSFVGLQEQVNKVGEEIKISNEILDQHHQIQDLEKLFRSSYLPAQFTLISVQKGTEDNTLFVKGVDRKTDFTLEVLLKYENIQLFVSHVKVVNNQKLTDYLQALLANDNLSLTKLLSLIEENKEIAQQTQPLDASICSQLQEKYKKELISCSNRSVKIQLGSGEKQEDGTIKPVLLYTFTLEKGKLTRVQISDKVLETKVLKELDLSLADATTTFYMITSIVGYTPQEETSGFGMKDQVLVTDKFVKYLGVTPDQVVSKGGSILVYFTLGKVKFIGTYDIVTSEVKPLSLDFGTVRRPVAIQKFSLILRDDQIDFLNSFALDPLAVLKQHNKALVKKYFPEEQ